MQIGGHEFRINTAVRLKAESLAHNPKVRADISDQNSLIGGKIKKMNPGIASLQVPIKEPVLAIRAQKCSFFAVHIQGTNIFDSSVILGQDGSAVTGLVAFIFVLTLAVAGLVVVNSVIVRTFSVSATRGFFADDWRTEVRLMRDLLKVGVSNLAEYYKENFPLIEFDTLFGGEHLRRQGGFVGGLWLDSVSLKSHLGFSRVNYSGTEPKMTHTVVKEGRFPVGNLLDHKITHDGFGRSLAVIDNVNRQPNFATSVHLNWVRSYLKPWTLIYSERPFHDSPLEKINCGNGYSDYYSGSFEDDLVMAFDPLPKFYERLEDSHIGLFIIGYWICGLFCAGRFLVCTGRYGGRVRPLQCLFFLLLAFVFTAHAIWLLGTRF